LKKKYQAELINFVNVIAKEIDMRLIESLNQIDNQRKIELNLDSWEFIEVEIDKDRLYQKYREYKGKRYDFKDYV